MLPRASPTPEASLSYAYSRFHRMTETSAIVLFATFASGLVWRVASTLDGIADWIILAVSSATGYAIADLVSGLVHWMADRFGSEHTPILGANFIRPFREHHSDPKAITQHDFIETNGSSCILSTPFLAVAFFTFPPTPSFFSSFLLAGTLAFCLAIFATNQFHKWAHSDSAPRFLNLLRRASLILTPEHHDVHHSEPFERNYCITVGWWNPVLERLDVFAHVETLFSRLARSRKRILVGARSVNRRQRHVQET